jgi:hypothetical protein
MSVLEQEAWDKGYACGKLDAAARIEALEAALRVIAIEMPSDSADKLRRIARAALAPERAK